MAVYRIRELLTRPSSPDRKGSHRPSLQLSVSSLSPDDLRELDQHSMSNSYQDSITSQRFYAEEQVSVWDFLQNRPNFDRHLSAPPNIEHQLPDRPQEKEETSKNTLCCASPTSPANGQENTSNLSGTSREPETESVSISINPTLMADRSLEICSEQNVTLGHLDEASEEHRLSSLNENSQVFNTSQHEGSDHEAGQQDCKHNNSNRNSVTSSECVNLFVTPVNSSLEMSPVPTQYYSPENSIGSSINCSSESEPELCMSLPTLTMSANKHPRTKVQTKTFSASVQNLANETSSEFFNHRNCTHSNLDSHVLKLAPTLPEGAEKNLI